MFVTKRIAFTLSKYWKCTFPVLNSSQLIIFVAAHMFAQQEVDC